MSSYPPHYAYPSSPPVIRAFPKPPQLHWAWVLVLSVVTLGLFAHVWLLVQALWVKKVRGGKSTAFVWAVAYWVFFGVLLILAIMSITVVALKSVNGLDEVAHELGLFGRFVGLVIYVATVSFLRGELQQSPIGIPLHGLATYIFGPVYFQSLLQHFSFANAATQNGHTVGLATDAEGAPVVGVIVEQDKSL